MALLNDTNILPFQKRVVKLKAKTVFKVLNGLLHSYIVEKLLLFCAIHSRETRNSKRNLKLPRHTDSATKNISGRDLDGSSSRVAGALLFAVF